MEKKLNLLKPDRRTVYLENGKGQKVDYLHISKDLSLDSLKSDVKAGAAQFKECMEFAKKKPSRVVLIECENEEEGLMAASYLAGAYNWKEKVYIEEELSPEYAELFDDEVPENTASNYEERSLEEYKNMEDAYEFNDDLEGYSDSLPEEEGADWIEDEKRIPIITLQEMIRYSNQNTDGYFHQGPFSMGGQQNVNNQEPYWLTTRREPVCILAELGQCYGMWGGDETALIKEIRRFATNRHVYVVIIGEKRNDNVGFSDWDDDEDDTFSGFHMDYRKEIICEAVLEFTAGTFCVSCEETARNKYYQVLFENWATHFGLALEKRFPKQDIAMQIVSMRNANKSAQIEKVYRYILSEERESNLITKEDFAVLKRFRILGLKTEKAEKSKKTIEKMETTLVGMEDVKRQIYSIIEVLKYNKARQKMGLGNNGYHNVHLLIGAPGTAKTTVAEMLGNMMCEQNLLPGNRFISINGADLKGMYVGHSAPKTKRYFDEYDIIFIDEAYSLTSERDMDSFSQEAIAQLIIELEKHGMDKLVMFAGYGGKNVSDRDNKMKMFLDANPGIRSRINSTIYFDSYGADEMLEIIHRQAENKKFQLTHEADEQIREYFRERSLAPDFGNGREARSFLENVTTQAARRLMGVPVEKLTKKMLQELTLADVEETLSQMRKAYKMQRGQERRKCGFLKGEEGNGSVQ